MTKLLVPKSQWVWKKKPHTKGTFNYRIKWTFYPYNKQFKITTKRFYICLQIIPEFSLRKSAHHCVQMTTPSIAGNASSIKS